MRGWSEVESSKGGWLPPDLNYMIFCAHRPPDPLHRIYTILWWVRNLIDLNSFNTLNPAEGVLIGARN